ncbi:MAG: DinB family protein [Thermoanaerobaculia bacterium]
MDLVTLRRTRPAGDEFNPSVAGYIGKVPDGDVVAGLERSGAEVARLFAALPEARQRHRYAPDKWSVRQVVAHLSDAERVFAYRLLRIGRGDTVPLAGYDQEPWAVTAHADERPWASLVEELATVRRSTLQLLASFAAEDWLRRGTANHLPVSARALAWTILGHELHHRAGLAEHYGVA